jgi:hypothetical protein
MKNFGIELIYTYNNLLDSTLFDTFSRNSTGDTIRNAKPCKTTVILLWSLDVRAKNRVADRKQVHEHFQDHHQEAQVRSHAPQWFLGLAQTEDSISHSKMMGNRVNRTIRTAHSGVAIQKHQMHEVLNQSKCGNNILCPKYAFETILQFMVKQEVKPLIGN